MGEAKRRKEMDIFYGHIPKYGKGIILTPHIWTEGEGLFVGNGSVDLVDLRRSVLFWDRIIRPENVFSTLKLSDEEVFLESCGILKKYMPNNLSNSGVFSHLYEESLKKTFIDLEAREPGIWAISDSSNLFDARPGRFLQEGRGALIELHRAIPLPANDVPLEDLLRFKEARRDELKSLTLELDGLFSRIVNSSDPNFEMRRAISEIDLKCSNVIRVGKESKIKFTLSDFTYNVSLDFNLQNFLISGGLGSIIGEQVGLPAVMSAIGSAAVSMLRFRAGLGGKLERSQKTQELAFSPYRVISKIINEPI